MIKFEARNKYKNMSKEENIKKGNIKDEDIIYPA